MRNRVLSLFLTVGLLTACGQSTPIQPNPTNPSAFLGKFEINFDLGATNTSPQAIARDTKSPIYLPGVPIAFTRLISKVILDNTVMNRRYITSTWEITNQTTTAFQNLTLFAFNWTNTTNPTIGGTPFRNIQNSALQPITNPLIAQGIRLEHGSLQSGTNVVVDPNNAHLQAFTSSEAQSLEDAGRALNELGGADDMLEYGFVVTNLTGGRSIPAGGTGRVALGSSYPIPAVASDAPVKYSMMIVAADETVTRVTRGFGETTTAAIARAGTPTNATEVAMFGSDTDIAPNPLKTVRLLQIKTFTDPANSPVTLGSSGGIVSLGLAKLEVPSGAVPANTSFAIEKLNTLPAPLPSGEEMGRISNARVVSGYRLRSSIAKFQDYIKFTVPIDIPATIPGDQLTTELYVWDGTKYDKVRIGSDDRSFEYTNYQMLGSSSGSLANVTDFLVVRAPTSSVSPACTAGGGTWNGIYCQGGVGALALRENRNTTLNQKVLSINVGNTDTNYCGLYLVKLCSYADEQKIGRYIASQNADIIALQETWHNQCFFVDTGDRDRLCSRATATLPGFGKQMERLLLTNQGYDTRCSPTVSFPNEPATSNKKIVNGFECIAIRKTLFEFTTAAGSSPATIQPPCETKPTGTYFVGSDTGSQVETIRPKTFVYRDPITASDLTLAQQAVEFDVVNSHLATSIPLATCTDLQITAISQRYFDLRPNLIRPLGKRLLLLGDYNRTYGNQSEAPFQTFAPFQAALNLATIEPPNATDPRRRIAYLLSNPNEFTASFLGVQFAGFDHVSSNFLELAGTGCVRGNRTANMDHNPTFCTLKGIDAGWTRGLIVYNQTNVDGTITQVPELNFMSARKYGVELTYVKTRQYVNTSGLHTVIGLSDAGPVILEFRRCKVTGPVNFESQFEVGSGGSVSFGPKIYPSVAVCI